MLYLKDFFDLFYVCECVVCMKVCVYTHAVPLGARGHSIPLGIRVRDSSDPTPGFNGLKSSGRAVRVLISEPYLQSPIYNTPFC